MDYLGRLEEQPQSLGGLINILIELLNAYEPTDDIEKKVRKALIDLMRRWVSLIVQLREIKEV